MKLVAVVVGGFLAISASAQDKKNSNKYPEYKGAPDPGIKSDPIGNGLVGGAAGGSAAALVKGGGAAAAAAGAATGAARSAATGAAISAAKNAISSRGNKGNDNNTPASTGSKSTPSAPKQAPAAHNPARGESHAEGRGSDRTNREIRSAPERGGFRGVDWTDKGQRHT